MNLYTEKARLATPMSWSVFLLLHLVVMPGFAVLVGMLAILFGGER
jgi:hypothetical protein